MLDCSGYAFIDTELGPFAMPRPSGADVGGEIYHAINRGNRRAAIFH
jgi:hypothetical protein